MGLSRAVFSILIPLALALPPAVNARGQWQSRAAMPSARTEVAAVELGGDIYVIGGYDQGADLVEAYDPAKDAWQRRAPLPKPLHHTAAAAVGGKIYVIGGYVSGVGPVNTVYEYDPAADQWTQKQPMPTARGALSVGVIGRKIFAVGGVGANGRNTIPPPTAGPSARR
jgi:N-acetylneuraminic acid mutarotase